MHENDYLTRSQLASRWNVCERTIDRYLRKHNIQIVRMFDRVLIPKTELDGLEPPQPKPRKKGIEQ